MKIRLRFTQASWPRANRGEAALSVVLALKLIQAAAPKRKQLDRRIPLLEMLVGATHSCHIHHSRGPHGYSRRTIRQMAPRAQSPGAQCQTSASQSAESQFRCREP